MRTIEMGGENQFHISAVRQRYAQKLPVWDVYLPHQCDDWSIAGYVHSKAEAIAGLELFIAEAQATLERLRELPEDAHDLD